VYVRRIVDGFEEVAERFLCGVDSHIDNTLSSLVVCQSGVDLVRVLGTSVRRARPRRRAVRSIHMCGHDSRHVMGPS